MSPNRALQTLILWAFLSTILTKEGIDTFTPQNRVLLRDTPHLNKQFPYQSDVLEKLIKTGLAERKGDKKVKYFTATHKGTALITVLPEQVQSPLMTAEWEEKLKLVERGCRG